jgi:hypothetical protein
LFNAKTVIGISIYKSYYVSEQKTKNINVYNLFKHKYNTRIKDKLSLSLSTHDEGYSINMSCALNLISMFLLKKKTILPVITHLYIYGGVKSFNGIPTVLSSVLIARGLND